MIRILKSEFYKQKHTWIPWVHLTLPIVYATLFYGAARITGLKNLNAMTVIQTYLLLIGCVSPIFCGIMMSKPVEMEMIAGHFQVLLSTTKSRSIAYLGKLLALLTSYLVALSLAIAAFGLLFAHQSPAAWIHQLFFIMAGSLAVYTIHLGVSLRFGISASIGLGFVESLIAFLSITSLGDQIWYFIPCTWAPRLTATYILWNQLADHTILYREFSIWACVAIPLTTALLLGSIFWFNNWDGQFLSE